MECFLQNIIPTICSQVINPRIKFTVNRNGLRKDFVQSIPALNNKNTLERNLKDSSGKLIINKINNLKNEMIQEFISHPITKEILSGPGGENISGTLDGYGNLFSFIGFNASDDPIGPIINLLQKTNYNFLNFNQRGQAKININMPNAQQIFDITPLPWAPGISWAQRMEIGMAGLGFYMNKSSDNSRSGGGIQATNQLRSGRFRNMPYISQFINSWEKKFNNITL